MQKAGLDQLARVGLVGGLGVQAGESPWRINPLDFPKAKGEFLGATGPLRLCMQRPRRGHWAAWKNHARVTLTPASVL